MPGKLTKSHKSIKHDIINRDSSKVVTAVGVAVFLVVFCGFAMKTLFSQSLYHNRVIGEKENTLRQLNNNVVAIEDLKQSYDSFVGEAENILGGSPSGNGPIDGNNAKIVLDSLPGGYNYPALSSSFEKILLEGGYDIESIGGSEDPVDLAAPTADAAPVEIPYSFGFSSDLEGTKKLLRTLERSIRPMHIDRIGIQINSEGSISTDISLHTYYTQQKTFELGSKEVN